MSFQSPTSFAALSPTPVTLTPGQTVLALGIIPNLPITTYNTPYIVQGLQSAAQTFGSNFFTRGLGELIRQNAPSIIAIAVYQESDLQAIGDYIKDIQFDILLPVGLTANQSRLNVFSQIAYERGMNGNPILVVMAVDPTPGVTALTSSPIGIQSGSELDLEADGISQTLIVNGRNFVFTLDTLTINPNVPSQYTAPAASTVAGVIARTNVSTSLTNVSVYGASAVSLYNNNDSAALASAGYLVLRQSPRKGLSTFLGVTGTSDQSTIANYSSDFHQISTIRIVNFVESQIKQLTIELIGDPAPTTLTDSVTGLLNSLQSQGVILAFSVDVDIQSAYGSVYISTQILPPFETNFISVTARINFTS